MLVTMTDKELYRLGIIQRVFDRALLQRDAADILKLALLQIVGGDKLIIPFC